MTLGVVMSFLNTVSQAQSMKLINHKVNFIKIIKFCSVKRQCQENERQDTVKICAKDTSDKGLLFKIYKHTLKTQQ